MSELWELVWGKPEVDPAALSRAIEQELAAGVTDWRTRLLIRDSTNVLKNYWGPHLLEEWLNRSLFRESIEAIQHEDLGKPGFLLSKEQLMDRTEPETVRQFLRELGIHIKEPVTLEVTGSIALILSGYLQRSTTDVDIVNEVPAAIRLKQSLLTELQERYRLLLTHCPSHYLPTGWETRLHDLGKFGSIQLYAVDVYDIFLGKLFSERSKDRDDLRWIKPLINKDRLTRQLLETTAALRQEVPLRHAADMNWYVLFGENLPPDEAGGT